jgi:hypothetical protein
LNAAQPMTIRRGRLLSAVRIGAASESASRDRLAFASAALTQPERLLPTRSNNVGMAIGRHTWDKTIHSP